METVCDGLASLTAAGIRLRLKVQPKARRDLILGVGPDRDGPALKVAVKAPPEDGKANAAAIALLPRHSMSPKRRFRSSRAQPTGASWWRFAAIPGIWA
jgi:uncharacterized protein YggU (UPF0235/DUF167 family)